MTAFQDGMHQDGVPRHMVWTGFTRWNGSDGAVSDHRFVLYSRPSSFHTLDPLIASGCRHVLSPSIPEPSAL